MKYLDLTKEEISTIKSFSRKRYFTSYITLVLLISIVSFIIASFIKSDIGLRRINGKEIIFLLSGGLSLVLALIYLGKHKYVVRKNINRKKVYSGIVSERKVKEKKGKIKYYLYMEGTKYKVSEKDYFLFQPGDPVEFHVCMDQKILLKVSKPSKTNKGNGLYA